MSSRSCGALRGAGASLGAALVALCASSAPAQAEPIEVGGFLGPRLFANQASLGHRDGIDIHLDNAMVLGPRIAASFFPWLVLEAELPLTSTSTNELDVDVFWMEPRLHARLEVLPEEKLRPFATIGAGMPIVLSERRGLFASDVGVDVYAGGGAHFSPGRGVNLRFDIRAAIVPAQGETVLAAEMEIGFGLWFALGKGVAPRPPEPPPDEDRDGIVDGDDGCRDRAEDHDGFEDRDGCPDIDNDGDRVLDIADKCPAVAELVNGFEDDDGCPDVMPKELDQIVGTIEGLLYGSGEIEVRATASKSLDKIIALLTKYPSVKVVVVGHVDNQEARLPIAPEPGETEPDPAALAVELSRARAGEVKRELLRRGIGPGRVDVDGKGAEEPVSDGDTPRARLRNRRVELRLFLPVR
jgi:outer membrane protein OmpA-like peptidoglycan-associated protein